MAHTHTPAQTHFRLLKVQ